jgi:hypothetical protein
MGKFHRPLSEVWAIERKRAGWVWLIGEHKFDLTTGYIFQNIARVKDTEIAGVS